MSYNNHPSIYLHVDGTQFKMPDTDSSLSLGTVPKNAKRSKLATNTSHVTHEVDSDYKSSEWRFDGTPSITITPNKWISNNFAIYGSDSGFL